MRSRDIVRNSARLDHQARKLARVRRETRHIPEVRSMLDEALRQIAQAVQALDQHAGEHARRELKGTGR